MEEDNNYVFIFYTLSSDKLKFDIKDVPEGWKWIGSGSTYPACNTENWKGKLLQLKRIIFGPPTKYKREEQFEGPSETKEEMKQYLDKKLGSLKEEGIIKFYHIQDTFLPVPV